jgi:4,5-DOPA dioxygenase extradiol
MWIAMTSLNSAFADLPATPRMPALFVGHGNPMNAIEDNSYSRAWRAMGERLPTPHAILCVSAHWMTRGTTLVHIGARPKTIHDFGGFPRELYAQQYPAPGAPDAAKAAIELVRSSHLETDTEWGLDHGAWSVLIQMFPKADIPVFQLSLDLSRAPQAHLDLARELKPLREKGVLVIGSGWRRARRRSTGRRRSTPRWPNGSTRGMPQASRPRSAPRAWRGSRIRAPSIFSP